MIISKNAYAILLDNTIRNNKQIKQFWQSNMWNFISKFYKFVWKEIHNLKFPIYQFINIVSFVNYCAILIADIWMKNFYLNIYC